MDRVAKLRSKQNTFTTLFNLTWKNAVRKKVSFTFSFCLFLGRTSILFFNKEKA